MCSALENLSLYGLEAMSQDSHAKIHKRLWQALKSCAKLASLTVDARSWHTPSLQ